MRTAIQNSAQEGISCYHANFRFILCTNFNGTKEIQNMLESLTWYSGVSD